MKREPESEARRWLLQGKEIQIKTFHSFCADLIKEHADRCKCPATSRYSRR